MRIAAWLARAFIFFVLFAFALNNQHTSTVHWFFGFEWRAPMVIVVLAALVCGVVLGVLAMLPSWWRARRIAGAQGGPATGTAATAASDVATSSGPASVPAAIYDGTVPLRGGV